MKDVILCDVKHVLIMEEMCVCVCVHAHLQNICKLLETIKLGTIKLGKTSQGPRRFLSMSM